MTCWTGDEDQGGLILSEFFLNHEMDCLAVTNWFRAPVINPKYFLHGADERRNGLEARITKAQDDVEERGRHADEVYQPRDTPLRTAQFEVGQL